MATKKFLKKLVSMSPMNILGIRYELLLCERRWKETGSPGTVNFPFSKIYLDVSLSDERILEVLLHEILEVIKDAFTIEIEHPELCGIHLGIMDVLRHNQEFRKAIGTMSSTGDGSGYTHEDFEEKSEDFPTGDAEEIYNNICKKTKKKKPRKGRKKQKAKGME